MGRRRHRAKKHSRRRRGISDTALAVLLACIAGLCTILYFFEEFVLLMQGALILAGIALCGVLAFTLHKTRRHLKQQRVNDERLKYRLRDYTNSYHLLDDKTMEHLVAATFRSLGFRAEVVGSVADGGIDIEMHKDGKWYAVQVKCYGPDNVVSAPEIREFHGSMKNRYHKGYFVTTSRFTAQGREWAQDTNIELIDGAAFRNMEIDVDGSEKNTSFVHAFMQLLGVTNQKR